MVLVFTILFLYIVYFHRSVFFKLRFGRGNISLIFANIGSGKTTLLAKLFLEENERMKKGKSPYRNIVSNVMIKGCYYCADIRGALKLGMFQDTLILADEGSIHWNNSGKSNMTHLEIEEFKLIRHYGCSCIVLSQDYSDISINMRRLYTKMYMLVSYGNTVIVQTVRKFITISEESQDFVNGYKFLGFIFGNYYFNRSKYYHLFDSYAIPDHIGIINIEKNIVEFVNGDIIQIPSRLHFEKIESADNMTYWEKKKLNRNVQYLLDKKIVKFANGVLVKVKTKLTSKSKKR